MENANVNFIELEEAQILNVNGGRCEVSMDRESAIMFSDCIRGFFAGLFDELFIR